MRRWIAPLLMLTLAACGDTDEDGLSNSREKKLGTDPESWDSDNDGASDLREVDTLTTDPLNPDSDADGYPDGAEDQAGSDPLDATSKIYQGGWPFYGNKDDIVDPGWDAGNGEGKTLPRFAFVDQFGDTVDIYDFAFHGKPIILDLSETRCYWCHEAGDMLEGEPSDFDGYEYPRLKDLVDNGDIYWVTVIDGYYPQANDPHGAAEDWSEQYPNPMIPVLVDEDEELSGWMDVQGVPTMFLIGEDMKVLNNSDYYTDIWDDVLEMFPE